MRVCVCVCILVHVCVCIFVSIQYVLMCYFRLLQVVYYFIYLFLFCYDYYFQRLKQRVVDYAKKWTWSRSSEQFEDQFSVAHNPSCDFQTFDKKKKKSTGGLFNCFSVVRLHLWDRGGVDTRCVIENTFLWEHKVPAVMATSTGVCVSVLVCGHHPRELVSCCFMQEITQLNQAAGSGAADAVESQHTHKHKYTHTQTNTLTQPLHRHTHIPPFIPN